MATRRSRRSATIVTLLLLTAVTIVALSAGGTGSSLTSGLRRVGSAVLSPVVSVVNTVTKPVGDFFAGAVNYGAVSDENAKLRAIIAKIQTQGEIQKYERKQILEVAALQHLTFVGSIPTVTAQSIALDQSNFASTIQINKGSNAGVGVGMPVVGSDGLIGQVVQTTRSTAIVRLVTDGRSKVGAVFSTSNLLGMVNGLAADRPLSVAFVSPNSAVSIGMLLYTNGLQGAQYPAGIPIGRVTSATSPPNADQMSITVNPAANLDSLGFVDVLLWNPTP